MKKKDCGTAETNKSKISVFTILFYFSLLHYVIWLFISIILAINGVDSGWAMPAMSDGELMYGWSAFWSGIVIGFLVTVEYFWWIPLYQIIFMIVMLVKKITNKCKQKNQIKNS